MQIRDKRKAGWFWIANEVLDALDLNPYQFTVYAALARFAGNENQQSWPSIPTLATRSGMSERKCQAVLRELETLGLIAMKRRYQENGSPTSNVYTLRPTGEPSSASATLVHDMHHPGAPGASKPDSLNQTPLNSTSDDKSSEVLVKKRQPTGRNLVKKQLEQHFCTVSGIPPPLVKTQKDRRAAGERWWKPLLHIASLVNDDVDRARTLINKALKQMDSDRLTVSAPGSIKSVATSIHGQQVRRGNGPGRILKVA